jgi:fido (protein-threonine AMPylation protein)
MPKKPGPAAVADNRFARQLEELDVEERELVKPAIAAARTSFAGFEERPGSEYHRAPGLSPEETWTRVAEELGRVSALAALQGFRDIPLALDDIELIHRGIFEPVFGERTLALRSGAADKVEFPITVGNETDPVIRQRRGSGVKRIRQNLGKAVANFEREVADLGARKEPPLADAALIAVKLYAKVIGVHPFLDGNGRTAWAIVSYALQRCSLVEIAIPPSTATRWALGQALRQDGSQSYEPLTELAVNAIRDSA